MAEYTFSDELKTALENSLSSAVGNGISSMKDLRDACKGAYDTLQNHNSEFPEGMTYSVGWLNNLDSTGESISSKTTFIFIGKINGELADVQRMTIGGADWDDDYGV